MYQFNNDTNTKMATGESGNSRRTPTCPSAFALTKSTASLGALGPARYASDSFGRQETTGVAAETGLLRQSGGCGCGLDLPTSSGKSQRCNTKGMLRCSVCMQQAHRRTTARIYASQLRRGVCSHATQCQVCPQCSTTPQIDKLIRIDSNRNLSDRRSL